MRRTFWLCFFLCACSPSDRPHTTNDSAPYCEAAQRVRTLPDGLREASGVAVSRRHPGTLWVHNDSGEPLLFALDTLGNLRARIAITTSIIDWEDIAVGPCGDTSCLYLGAIGDNRQNRTDRMVLRLREPALADTTVEIDERFPYRLPGGPQDMEALFVTQDERIYLISKGRSGPISLYGFPHPASSTEANPLVELQRLTPGLVQLPEMVTGAAAAMDGKTVVIRTYSALQLYSFDGAQLAPLLATTGFNLESLREHQGEGVDISPNGTIYLVSEKGLDEGDPPLSRVRCSLSAR